MKLRREVLVGAGRGLALLSIGFLLVKLGQHFDELPKFTWSISGAIVLGAVAMLSVANVALSAYVWMMLLRGGGTFITLRRAYVILGRSQIAKYLPGNVFQYVGWVGMGHRAGIPMEAMLVSISVQTLLVAGTSASIALGGLCLDLSARHRLTDQFNGAVGTWSGLALIAIGVLAMVGSVSPRVRGWVRRRLGYLHPGRVALSMFLCAVVLSLFGMAIPVMLKVLWEVTPDVRWYQFTWGYALAWVVGFLVPGAPGGIGIRESVLVAVYHGELGAGLVIALALVLRMTTTLGDLLACGLAYCLDGPSLESE